MLVTGRAVPPSWLLPSRAPFELVGMLHKLYPGFSNGWRCISGALQQSSSQSSYTVLIDAAQSKLNTICEKLVILSRTVYRKLSTETSIGSAAAVDSESQAADAVRRAGERAAVSRAGRQEAADTSKLLLHYASSPAFARPTLWERFDWVGYSVGYIVLEALYRRYVDTGVPMP